MRISLNGLVYVVGFLAISMLLCVGFYLEYVQGIEPCPLCIIQRVFFSLIGLVCLMAFLRSLHRKDHKIYGLLITIFSILGALSAGRQIWLQKHPQEALSEVCVPGLKYMMTYFPFAETLKFLFLGSSHCSEVTWTLLGLSIAEWSLISFSAFIGLGVYQMWMNGQHP